MGAKYRRKVAAGQEVRRRQKQLAATEQRLGLLAEVLDAVVDLVGRDMVAKNVERLRRERANETLQAALDAGQLVAADTVTTDSLVEGTEFPPTGDKVSTGPSAEPSTGPQAGPSRLKFANFLPGVQVQLLGKRVGDSVATPNGGRFVVDAIYQRAAGAAA